MTRRGFDELTYIGQAQRLHRLAKNALSAYGLEGAEARLIKYRHNAVFQIDIPNGTERDIRDDRYVRARYVLRIHRPGYQTAGSVASELAWLRALRFDTDLVVPEPVSTLDRQLLTEASSPDVPEARICSLLRWVKGRAYRRPRPTQLTAIGEVMAKLHNHTDEWSPPSGFTRRRLDWGGLFAENSGFDPSPQEIWTSLPRPHARLFEAVAEKVREAMHELGDGPEAFGLIHADLHTRNILFSRKETRVIDFDDCGFGHRVYDMAVGLLENGHPSRRDDLLRGYARHRPVPEDQLAFLEKFIAARRLGNAVSAIQQTQREPQFAQRASRWLETTARAFELFMRTH